MPKKKKPDLAIAVDFGGSGTKVFYALPGSNKVGSFLMEPEVAEVPKSAISNLKGRVFGSGLPENEAWIELDGEYAAVGYLVVSQSLGFSHLSGLKYDQAVWKFLAAVWVVSARCPELGQKFKLVTTVLLPGGEYADRVRLQRDLKVALASFGASNGKLSVEMLSFECLPEGAGIYLGYRSRASKSFFSERIALFMLGYRNASLLVSDRGTLGGSKQSDLGMVRMIEMVQSRTSGLDGSQLAAAVYAAGDKVERAPLFSICRSLDRERRSEEADRLVKAVHLARDEYTSLLWNWINEVFPDLTDRLVFSGGTVDYLRSEIESRYTVTPVDFHGGLVVPSEYVVESSNRFVDVWAVFLGLLAELKDKFGVEFELPTSHTAVSGG